MDRDETDYGLWYWNDPPVTLVDKVCWGKCVDSNVIPLEMQTEIKWVCKTCRKQRYTLIRKCVNSKCERIFLKDFFHPAYCIAHPLCWLCCEERRTNSKLSCDEQHSRWYHNFVERMAETPIIPPKVLPRADYNWEDDVLLDFEL